MKKLRLIPFLLAMMLTGCTFFIERPAKEESAEEPESASVENANYQTVNQDSLIYHVVEYQASYPGGDKSLFKYLGGNLKYPQAAVDARIEGTVYVQFVVEKDGSLSDIKIAQGHLGGGCEEAAILAVRKMPRWNPGTHRGKAVRTRYILPVEFQISD